MLLMKWFCVFGNLLAIIQISSSELLCQQCVNKTICASISILDRSETMNTYCFQAKSCDNEETVRCGSGSDEEGKPACYKAMLDKSLFVKGCDKIKGDNAGCIQRKTDNSINITECRCLDRDSCNVGSNSFNSLFLLSWIIPVIYLAGF